MADAIQPATRNLYQKKFAFLEYRDGAGHSYAEQIRLQSWPNNEDVPPQAQPSSREIIESGGYDLVHPKIIRLGAIPNFMQTYKPRSHIAEANPRAPVHERLYTPSRTVSRPPSRSAASRPEVDADSDFRAGALDSAIAKYSIGIGQRPTLLAYEKRCAAWAHVGKYKKALADAEHVLKHENSARAANRVKTIEAFLAGQRAAGPGTRNAHVTLCLALTPRELRQWRSQGPSLYNL